ncbi:MAG: DNA-processing protein DprA [Solirubrobacteraceae bacterium]|jgi:DNA processing protein
MSRHAEAPEEQTACAACVRRSWLLGVLSALLDYHRRDRERLSELLALEDRELIQAIAGTRRAELMARHERFDPSALRAPAELSTVCRHDRRYPGKLTDRGAPHMLYVVGGTGRLRELTDGATVAIVGSKKPSDYGMEIARSLARGLAASGVTVRAL